MAGSRPISVAAGDLNGDSALDLAVANHDSGDVSVLIRNGDSVAPQANTGCVFSRDGFGESVALSGDTLAVGSTGEDSAATGIDGDQADNSAEDSGAVYAFQ